MNDGEGKKHHGIRIRSYRLTDFLFDLGLLSSGRGSVSCGGRTTRACRGHLDNISSTITSSKGRLMRWIGFQTERVYQRKWGWLFIGHRGWGLAGPGHRHPIPCGLRWHARASPFAHHPPADRPREDLSMLEVGIRSPAVSPRAGHRLHRYLNMLHVGFIRVTAATLFGNQLHQSLNILDVGSIGIRVTAASPFRPSSRHQGNSD